jgi:PE family
MTSMSHDPAAAVIGAQLVEMSTAAVAAGAAAAPSVTALVPAGAEEISVMASTAFGAAAEMAFAAHVAAQQELAKAGAALMDIARMYAQTDATAAGALEANAMQTTLIEAAGFTSSTSGRLLRSEALPGAAGTVARTPLMANLVEGAVAAPAAAAAAAVTPATGATTIPAVTGAASTLLGAASAPLSSLSSLTSMGGSMGGAAGGSAAAVPASLTDKEEPVAEDGTGQQTGQGLV